MYLPCRPSGDFSDVRVTVLPHCIVSTINAACSHVGRSQLYDSKTVCIPAGNECFISSMEMTAASLSFPIAISEREMSMIRCTTPQLLHLTHFETTSSLPSKTEKTTNL